ncbi:hypothetical protein A2U01_0082503, partial [Trifolium medium]|nr:hypothetical protein [Trifolium medium]
MRSDKSGKLPPKPRLPVGGGGHCGAACSAS